MDKLSSPHFCCTQGGEGTNFQTILTTSVNSATKKKQPTIFPVFVVETEKDHLEPASQYLLQEYDVIFQPIINVDCLGKRFAFQIPKQRDPKFQNLIQTQELALFITLQRTTDDAFAEQRVKFTYFPHRETDCLCHHFDLDFVSEKLKRRPELMLRINTPASMDSGTAMDDHEEEIEAMFADAFEVINSSSLQGSRKRRKTIELGFQNIQLAEENDSSKAAVKTPSSAAAMSTLQTYCLTYK